MSEPFTIIEDASTSGGMSAGPPLQQADWAPSVGSPAGQMGGSIGGSIGASMGGDIAGAAGISDAVTNAMVNHFARELTHNSLSLWPFVVQSARRYFNVTHGYVLKKALWQLLPKSNAKAKSVDGEIGAEKTWDVRLWEGLEMDIEEPDMYIPAMGFVTYVLLCGMIRGVQDAFHPDVLGQSISFAVLVLLLEVSLVKTGLFMAGATQAPVSDLVALSTYKYFHLSLSLISALLLGFGSRPEGYLYQVLNFALMGSCGVALWQSLRRLARMQPSLGQECMTDVHKILIKGIAAAQIFLFWCLTPSWPKAVMATLPGQVASAVASTTLTAVEIAVAGASAAELVGNATAGSA